MNKIDFDSIALTQSLVKCPSVTPKDEGALQIIEDHLKNLKFDCTRLIFTKKREDNAENTDKDKKKAKEKEEKK